MSSTPHWVPSLTPRSDSQEFRKRIHQLVDRLSEEELPTDRRVLEGLQALDDPVLRALVRASEEQDPISEEERAALPCPAHPVVERWYRE